MQLASCGSSSRPIRAVARSQCIALAALLVTLTWGGAYGAYTAPGIQQQAIQGRSCITRFQSAGNNATTGSTLAVVYLHAHTAPSQRDSFLACSIRQLIENLGQATPIHVYVFVLEPLYDALAQRLLEELGDKMYRSRVCILKIPQEQWDYNPRKMNYRMEQNSHRPFGHGYYVMGLWRLIVPFNLMATLGYPYVLQVDDDLIILQPYKENLVESMRAKGQLMATHRMPVEFWNIMYGLPELARFYLASNNVTAGGSLFEHLTPPNMNGLHSITRNWWRHPERPRTGYDLIILYGNWMVMSTELWMSEKVQDWITLCISSGGLERHRWQEQGVISWVWLLFTEPKQLLHLQRSQLRWIHTRRKQHLQPICGKLG